MVPHAIITVSLATAMLPALSRHAADDDLPGMAANVASTLRTTYTLIIPFALLLPVIAYDLADIALGWGAALPSVPAFALSISLFAPGVVLFTTHYLMLRGFYALERTRTVFWVQCAVAGTNIVLAVAATRALSAKGTAPGLVLAYAGAYLVGAVVSYSLLRGRLGGLETPALARFLGRLLLAAGISTALAWAARVGLQQVWPTEGGKVQALVVLVITAGLDIAVFLPLARLLRITEVTSVLGLVTDRLRR
jgi:putative peptidoglycan lipid II flippase